MLKKNFQEAIERNKRFLKRQMMDGILLNVTAGKNPYLVEETRSKDWGDRECLSISDREWVLEDCRRKAKIHQDIDDDTIPEGYPTLHFGESVYAYLLGGEVQFVGNDYHTCSGAKPLIKCEADMEKLKGFETNEYVKIFSDCAKYFADETKGDFWLKYVISIDALNLAVELLGTTEAYIAVQDDEALLRKIMEFGVDFNEWFYHLQKDIYAANNKAALEDEELYELYDKTWYSIDAYDICNPDVYKRLGFEYQQELINRVGGGMLHTHGTGLIGLMPEISKLKGLGMLQLSRDLYSSEHLEFDHIREFSKMTGDTPLTTSISEHEFLDGIKNKTLPGGTRYTCWVEDVDTANKLAYMAKEYKL